MMHALVLVAAAFLPQAAQPAAPAPKPAAKAEAAAPKAKPVDERTQRGRDMLAAAEALSGGLEGNMRAYSMLQLANAYALSDKPKAVELLQRAFAVTTETREETPSKTQLQKEILQALAPLNPAVTEELLPQAAASVRGDVLNALLGSYIKNKQTDKAIEMVLQVARQGEFPYKAVDQLMQSLPKEDSVNRQALFTAALDNQKSHPEARGMRMGDLSSMIVRYWTRLPVAMVKEAIDTVLDQADPEKNSGSDNAGKMTITLASAKGTAGFNSLFEFRAYQLLPVLRKLDESEAAKLTERLQRMNPTLKDAPSDLADTQAGGQNTMMAVSMGDGPGPAPPPRMVGMNVGEVGKIMAIAKTHPQDALAQAAMLEPNARLRALQGIARVNLKDNESVSRAALKQVLDLAPQLELEPQESALESAASLYLQMKDTESAQKALAQAGKVAETMYKEDTNKDDPNQALKAYWPSTAAWMRLVQIADGISPRASAEIIHGIDDPEIQVTQQLALAGTLLGLPLGPSLSISTTKSGTSMMMTASPDAGNPSQSVNTETSR